MHQQHGIRTQHPSYTKLAPVWKKCRDAAEGERAIHAGGEAYLPKLKEETLDDYKARLDRTPFFGAYWRTISGLKGMLFRKAPLYELPAGTEDIINDIDMAGTPLDIFAQELAEELLIVGRIGVLVDHPSESMESVTISQAAQAGLRPTLQQYPAETITNWKSYRINNVVKLTLVVLKEKSPLASETEYSHEAEDHYRELTLINIDGNPIYRQRVFAVRDDKDVLLSETIPLMDGKPLNEIPFVFFGVDTASPQPNSPPLEDLLNMNLHHYQVSADYEHGCHFSGLPTFCISGYSPPNPSDKVAVGGASALVFTDSAAHAYYAEVSGTFQALLGNLDGKKQEMAILGARLLEAQKASTESAETIRQRNAGENSQLGGMAQIMSMCMEKILIKLFDWAGYNGFVSYKINNNFVPSGVTPEQITAYLSAVQSGRWSEQTFFYNMQKGEIYEPGLTFEEEQGRIGSQAPIAVA
jgi:hypothetical protein